MAATLLCKVVSDLGKQLLGLLCLVGKYQVAQRFVADLVSATRRPAGIEDAKMVPQRELAPDVLLYKVFVKARITAVSLRPSLTSGADVVRELERLKAQIWGRPFTLGCLTGSDMTQFSDKTNSTVWVLYVVAIIWRGACRILHPFG